MSGVVDYCANDDAAASTRCARRYLVHLHEIIESINAMAEQLGARRSREEHIEDLCALIGTWHDAERYGVEPCPYEVPAECAGDGGAQTLKGNG